MNKEEYLKAKKALEEECAIKKKHLAREFVYSNNPVKIGDIITDHYKTIESVKSAIRKAVDERKEKTWYDFHGIAYEEMYEFLGDKYVTIPKDEYKHMLRCKEELADLLRNANRRRKSAERAVRKMRRISDDAMTAISSRQRTIEEQWEVMRELQRRGLVSTEDLEAVLKDVMHVVRVRF